MNKIQRRLFRAFLDSGGNITDEVELERFVRYVEAVLSLLPPKLRLAVDLAWRASDSSPYVRVAGILSQREGTQVSPQALRQRVSRGLRELEGQVRQRQWDHGPTVNGTRVQPPLRPAGDGRPRLIAPISPSFSASEAARK